MPAGTMPPYSRSNREPNSPKHRMNQTNLILPTDLRETVTFSLPTFTRSNLIPAPCLNAIAERTGGYALPHRNRQPLPRQLYGMYAGSTEQLENGFTARTQRNRGEYGATAHLHGMPCVRWGDAPMPIWSFESDAYDWAGTKPLSRSAPLPSGRDATLQRMWAYSGG